MMTPEDIICDLKNGIQVKCIDKVDSINILIDLKKRPAELDEICNTLYSSNISRTNISDASSIYPEVVKIIENYNSTVGIFEDLDDMKGNIKHMVKEIKIQICELCDHEITLDMSKKEIGYISYCCKKCLYKF